MTSFEPPHPQDKAQILKRIPVFASCTDRQLELIAERTRLVEFKKGECVYRQGHEADAFYMVISGRLRVITSTNGRDDILAVLHNGDSFGEVSLLTGERHSATIEALNDTLVLKLGKEDFDHVINEIPSLVMYLSKVLSKRLRTKAQADGFREATIAAICGAAPGMGCSSLSVALAGALTREARVDMVLLDLGGKEEPAAGSGLSEGPATHRPSSLLLAIRSDENLSPWFSTHPLGFQVLSAGEFLSLPEAEDAIAPLLSTLTKAFHYVLVDLPPLASPAVLKALSQSDVIYVVTDASQEYVNQTAAWIRHVRAQVVTGQQRVKVVLNTTRNPIEEFNLVSFLQPKWERLTRGEVAQQIGHPVDFVLPYVRSPSGQLSTDVIGQLLDERGSPYFVSVRRMARELAGMLVGLALGSGAALGLAHIGVLKVLERERIPIDVIAGSSIGALIAGMWATGHPAEELERLALRFKHPWDIRRLFVTDLGIPAFSLVIGALGGVLFAALAGALAGTFFGILLTVVVGLATGPLVGGPIQGEVLMRKLEADFGGKTFEEAWLPLKVVASNPMSREQVVIDSGSLAEAVRASVSIPGIFKPAIYRGKICLDGGVVNPVPVSVTKDAGANRVIAVNVFPSAAEIIAYQQQVQRQREEWDAELATRSFPVRLLARLRQELQRSFSPFVFDIIMRSMQSMEHQMAQVACRQADLTLRPTLASASWLDFHHPEQFIERGEEEAVAHLDEIRRLVGMPPTVVDNPQGGQ